MIKIDARYTRFVIGTKDRPTMFLTEDADVSASVEEAKLFSNSADPYEEIRQLDDHDSYQLYFAEVVVKDL